MNYEKEVLASVLSSLNWVTAQKDYAPGKCFLSTIIANYDCISTVLAPLEPTSGRIRSERQRLRLDKRKLTSDALTGTRQELFSGGFDGLLVASEYDPFEIVEILSSYLAGSASIVVQNMFLQVTSYSLLRRCHSSAHSLWRTYKQKCDLSLVISLPRSLSHGYVAIKFFLVGRTRQ